MTIVTPSLNQGKYIRETIESVMRQQYPGLEYIVFDGGSTDDTLDILKSYPHLKWLSERDRGQSDAINKGFDRAQNDIVAWINSDDMYYPGALKKIASLFEQDPSVDLLYGYHNDIDGRDQVIRKGMYFPFYRHAFEVGFAICQPTSFWRRKVWESCGPLDTKLHYCMDYDFYAKAIKTGFNIKSVPVLVCQFRYHVSNKGTIAKWGFMNETKTLFMKHCPKRHSGNLAKLFSRAEYLFLIGARRILRIF